jgi:hypothetical protein
MAATVPNVIPQIYDLHELLNLIDVANCLQDCIHKHDSLVSLRDALNKFLEDDPAHCEANGFYGAHIVAGALVCRTRGYLLYNWLAENYDADVDKLWHLVQAANDLLEDDPYRYDCLGILKEMLNEYRAYNEEYCNDRGFYGVDIVGGDLLGLDETGMPKKD